MAGAGGLAGEIGEGLVRKGVGTLIILDDDVVEPSNLNRQRFFRHDIYKPKASRLAKNLAREGFAGTVLRAYDMKLQDAAARGLVIESNLVIVGVDNNPARTFAAQYFHARQIPVITTAVSRTANNGYVFVQEPGGPCFGCLFPDSINDETYPCPGTPAVKDILKVVAGMVIFAVDTILMERPRFWNYKDIFLDGSVPGSDRTISRRTDCQLCSVPDAAEVVHVE
jgi:molybdopterin/thiamine biosynthesis adenylyltransferase